MVPVTVGPECLLNSLHLSVHGDSDSLLYRASLLSRVSSGIVKQGKPVLFRCLDMCVISRHTTPTFITEVLCLITYVLYNCFNDLELKQPLIHTLINIIWLISLMHFISIATL